ncbi:hypothetical protein [Sphingobium sp. CAP-1]|uniref:hypothetical protein n=1 Tax=Sphingobium sp. CAP-1 TaxID=2676077 RepID=UPI0012BB2859|nr:hypothetical protein [Sphingobium sp. CAP-1]QGP79960.1 hypothetical protein GL174_13955 [Sphingobium sp. CAP-1]
MNLDIFGNTGQILVEVGDVLLHDWRARIAIGRVARATRRHRLNRLCRRRRPDDRSVDRRKLRAGYIVAHDEPSLYDPTDPRRPAAPKV